MKKIFITGISSGLGRELAKTLVSQGNIVWGVARREQLMQSLQNEVSKKENLFFTTLDLLKKADIQKLIKEFQQKKFFPEVVILNAAIYEQDFKKSLLFPSLIRMNDINYLSVLRCVHFLIPLMKNGSQFIAISSSSALKGSAYEGIGYAASKAALSSAFESLYLIYKDQDIIFTTVHFGPIQTAMKRLKNMNFMGTTTPRAVKIITDAIQQRKPVYYYPPLLFFFLHLLRCLPSSLVLFIISSIERRLNSKYAYE